MMPPNNDEIQIASYSEHLAAGVLLFIVVPMFIAIVPMCWFIGAIGLVYLALPAGLSLMIWGQLHERAISVHLSDCVTVRTLRRTVKYDNLAAWSWFDNDELRLYFGTPTAHSWRIRATWQQVAEAKRWLRPELLDVDPYGDDLTEQEWHAFRLRVYQDFVDMNNS